MNDQEYIKWVEECANNCDCCPQCQQHPCDGVMAGGICDYAPCECFDEYDA